MPARWSSLLKVPHALCGHGSLPLVTVRLCRRQVQPPDLLRNPARPNEVAEREAWEEADVKGKAEKKPGIRQQLPPIVGAPS